MISVNKLTTKDSAGVETGSITGSVNGIHYGVAFSPELFTKLQDLESAALAVTTQEEYQRIVEAFLPLTKEDYKASIESKIPNVFFNEARGTYHLKQGTLVSEEVIPKVLVDRMLDSVDKGIDAQPLVKLYTRILRSPVYSADKAEKICWYIMQKYVDHDFCDQLMEEEGVSREVALARATGYQTPVTLEGLICTFKVSEEVTTKWIMDPETNERKQVPRYTTTKVVDEDSGEVTTTSGIPEVVEERLFRPAYQKDRGDAFFCGDKLGHFIRVGQVHALENWNQVNTNDHQSAVPGLHCGNLDYIRNYQNAGTVTHETFVDPMHIGAVVQTGDGALRVKQYFTFASSAGPNRGIYHSSDYAKYTDAEWEVIRTEAILALQAKQDALVLQAAALSEQN